MYLNTASAIARRIIMNNSAFTFWQILIFMCLFGLGLVCVAAHATADEKYVVEQLLHAIYTRELSIRKL